VLDFELISFLPFMDVMCLMANGVNPALYLILETTEEASIKICTEAIKIRALRLRRRR